MDEKLIIEILNEKGEPMKVGDIATAIGVDKKEVDKAIKLMVKEDKMYSPKRCFYDVKK